MDFNKTPLSGLPAGTVVRGLLLLQSSRMSVSRNQKPFMVWDGLDVTGSHVYGTYFGPDTPAYQFPRYDTGTVLDIQGTIGQSQNGLSLWATGISQVVDPAIISGVKSVCFPTVPLAELTKYIDFLTQVSTSFSDPVLNQVSAKMFEFILSYLSTHPAGKSVHEPLRGGLAKHTYEVVRLFESPIFADKGLNRDVLLFSALYHDIGKTQEYTEDMTYGPIGRLISHSVIAIQLLTNIFSSGLTLNPSLRRQIMHCILAHHGEFSEIKPATKEAIALHFADNMMAKIGHIEEQVRQNQIGSDGWGPRSYVLDTSPYVPELDDRK